jgi:hypothetical protein
LRRPDPTKSEPNRISRKDAKTRRKKLCDLAALREILAQCARIPVPRYQWMEERWKENEW